MALSVKGKQVETVLRKLLSCNGYKILNARRKHGENNADLIVKKGNVHISIECIGFQEAKSTRSKQFYEVFFRTISRLKDGANRCVMALPFRFNNGMNRRARQYGISWSRIGKAFPELEIWLVDVQEKKY
jgi:hypothetical protein